MQSVLNLNHPNGTSYFCGTGHGGEVVNSVELFVDGKLVPFTSGLRQTSGSVFQISKKSSICSLSAVENVTFDEHGITQEFTYVVEDTADVNFMCTCSADVHLQGGTLLEILFHALDAICFMRASIIVSLRHAAEHLAANPVFEMHLALIVETRSVHDHIR